MIGRLQGYLLEKQPPNLLIDVGGVGYDVQAPMTTFYQLPDLGAETVLHIHLAVSETAQQLYGFYSKDDRSLFRQLIKVSGVGPKMALGIMSGMDSDEFVRCVKDNRVSALVKVPGVGKKTAERLIIDMRDRLKDWRGGSTATPSRAAETNSQTAANLMLAEAESALVALGYKPTEAARAIAAVVDQHPVTRCEDLIRLTLRSMMPK